MASTRTQQQEHPRQLKHLLSELPEIETKSGNVGASINLTNAIVGSGIIGIPFAVSESGFVVGMLLLIFVSVLAGKFAFVLFVFVFCRESHQLPLLLTPSDPF